jgi:thiamine transport system ATP-binding protein
MHAGRIEQVGTPTEVWQRPANPFVARFLGWNVTRAFSDALVAVRPESVLIVDGSDGGVPGRVASRTFRRDHFLLAVALDDDDPVQVEVAVDAEHIPDIGDRVALRADDLVALD